MNSLIKTAVRCAIATSAAGLAAHTASATSVGTFNFSGATSVFISGSTALDNTLTNAVIETAGPGGLCQSGTADIYLIGSTNKLVLCSASSSSGITAGTPLAIYKESQVGSANGVQPLINAAQGTATGLNFINPSAISDASCGSATVPASGDFSSYVNHAGCASSATSPNGIPTGGFADVEAAILRTAVGAPISASLTSTYLSATPTLDQVWGVALTKNAFYALQAAEGLTSPSDLPANAPSLSHQQVANLISGDVFSWSLVGLAPTDSNVYICRRDDGSGTEASFEAYFLGERCSLSSESVPPEDGAVVWANASAGAMRTCLQHMYAGGTQTSYYYPGTAAGGGTATHTFPASAQYAIGFLNTEITAANLSGAGDSFRIIAVDGALPTIPNVQNGVYPYFSTGNAYQIKAGSHIPTGNPKFVFAALAGKIGHPVWTADSNTNYKNQPWGSAVGDVSPAGLFAASVAGTWVTPATTASVATVGPVNGYTKTGSGNIDNCDTPIFDAADLPSTATGQTGFLQNN